MKLPVQVLHGNTIPIIEDFEYKRTDRIHKNAKDARGDELCVMLLDLKRFARHVGLNSKEECRLIAGKLIDREPILFLSAMFMSTYEPNIF